MRVRKPNNVQLQIAQITTRCPSHSDLLLALTRQLWSCGVRSGFRCAGRCAVLWLPQHLQSLCLTPASAGTWWIGTMGWYKPFWTLNCAAGVKLPWEQTWEIAERWMLQCDTRCRFPCLGHPWLFADAWVMTELRLPLYIREMLSGLLLEAREVFAVLQGVLTCVKACLIGQKNQGLGLEVIES